MLFNTISRDHKAWAQMAPSVLFPYLAEEHRNIVFISLKGDLLFVFVFCVLSDVIYNYQGLSSGGGTGGPEASPPPNFQTSPPEILTLI